MKRITLLLFVFSLPIVSFFISCKAYHYRTTAIRAFAAKEISGGEYEEVKETVIESLTFGVQGITEHTSEAKSLGGFAQPLYAAFDPPEDVPDNQIIYEKTEVVLDKDIHYKGQLIEKGTNLMMHTEIKDHTWLKHLPGYASKGARFVIGFDEQFYTDIDIPEDEYTITVICHTDDELKLESNMVKTIKLKE